jgi:hypothetical protein
VSRARWTTLGASLAIALLLVAGSNPMVVHPVRVRPASRRERRGSSIPVEGGEYDDLYRCPGQGSIPADHADERSSPTGAGMNVHVQPSTPEEITCTHPIRSAVRDLFTEGS